MYLLSCLILGLMNSAAAHDAPVDGLGCHAHQESGTYHCHEGPLSGRTFVDKQSGINAMLILDKEAEATPGPAPASVPEPAPVVAEKVAPPPPEIMQFETGEPLKLIAWTAPGLGKNEIDYKKVAHLISIADIVIFQGVSSTDLGSEGLKMLGVAFEGAIKEKICKAWTNVPGKPRSAVLWKDSKLAYVKDNGVLTDTCGTTAQVVRTNQVSVNLFSRASKRMLSIALHPSGVWRTQWPTVLVSTEAAPGLVAGLTPRKKPLRSLEHGFKIVQENLWVRGLGAQDARIVDLVVEYPDIQALRLPKFFSDYCPIYTELRFPVDPDAPVRLPTSDILN